jgi:hypothetical protein
MALFALLFASSGIVQAQNSKEKTTPAPVKAAPAPAPAARPAPAPAARPATTPTPAPAGRATPNPATNVQPGRAPATNVQPGRNPEPNVQPGRNPNPNFQPGRNPNPNVQPGRNPNPNFQPGRNPNPNFQPGRNPGNPGPRPEFHGANGSSARFDPRGRPTVVHTHPNVAVYHAPDGSRRIVAAGPGGRVFVTNARGHGYVQGPRIVVGGRPFVQRTYIVGGRPYVRVYRPLVYRGVAFNVYTPVRFYNPRFYMWAYTPWALPVRYNFGFVATPWFGFYAGYFSPYPVYAGPNYWLTDYMLSADLQEAYQERMDAQAQGAYDQTGQVALTGPVKDQIASEVSFQLNQDRLQSQNPAAMPPDNAPPPILADNDPKVFVVSSNLIVSGGGQECALTEGDVLKMTNTPSTDPQFATVQVLASKGQDCAANSIQPVELADLQEMQNHMRATIDQGLGEMQSHQGQSGLPAIDASLRQQTDAPYASPELTQPDTGAAAELQQQAQQATQDEQTVLGQAGASQVSSGAPCAPGGTIRLGQSEQEVTCILGRPNTVADLGQKKIYSYKDMKVIFLDGKVSDVQ